MTFQRGGGGRGDRTREERQGGAGDKGRAVEKGRDRRLRRRKQRR